MGLRRWLRGFARICVLPMVLLAIPAIAGAAGDLVYVGTYTGHGSRGIYAFRFDPAGGGSVSLGLAAATENPSFLAVDPKGRFLYAVNETGAFQGQPTGAISVFGIDRGTGRLDLLQQVPSLGPGPRPPVPGQDGPVPAGGELQRRQYRRISHRR